MIVNDDPGANDARALTNYMAREGHELRNPAGHEMDEDELNNFHEKSDEYGFTRHFVLAPEGDHLDEKELDRAARKSMNEWSQDKDSLEYAYSVHDDDENNHVHVAATASKESGDLWFENNDELAHLRDDIAADHFRDHTTERQREMMIEQGREDELRQEDRERELAEQRQQEHKQEQEQQPDLEQDQALELGGGEMLAAGAMVGDLGAAGAEMSPASWLLEAYREEQRSKQQQQQEHNRGRSL